MNNIKKLKKYLERENIAQAEFARRSGLVPVDISRALLGQRRPSPRIALAIESATGGEIQFREWFTE